MKTVSETACWYEEGLHFSCTGCGACCTGSPGYVWVNEDEIQAMADFLKLSIQEFSRKFLRKIGNRFSLVEMRKTYDCIFLKDRKCQIYEVRPVQCRTFPWWPENLSSPQAWEDAAQSCEGICNSAPRQNFETIESQKLIQLKRNGKEDSSFAPKCV